MFGDLGRWWNQSPGEIWNWTRPADTCRILPPQESSHWSFAVL